LARRIEEEIYVKNIGGYSALTFATKYPVPTIQQARCKVAEKHTEQGVKAKCKQKVNK
jgi:hypothetical protein